MLVDALGGDEMAPMYVMRIWGHCQQRRGDSFAMPAAGLKAMCRAMCDAQALETALIDAGFIQRDGQTISVPKWAEKNASLIAAWDNGGKGGRPKKEPSRNPRVTQSEPNRNPTGTQQEPKANPDGTQTKPIREEKKNTPISPQGGKRQAAIGLKAWLEAVHERGELPIPEGDEVFAYADEVGIPLDFLRLAWLEFRHRYSQPDAKRYIDWRKVFRKSVRANWLKLWWIDPTSNEYQLTTVGKQAQRAHQERRQA
jgi:hypothetical protein